MPSLPQQIKSTEVFSVDPQSLGRSWPEDRRCLISLPLAVVYRISEPDRLVTVIDVFRVDVFSNN